MALEGSCLMPLSLSGVLAVQRKQPINITKLHCWVSLCCLKTHLWGEHKSAAAEREMGKPWAGRSPFPPGVKTEEESQRRKQSLGPLSPSKQTQAQGRRLSPERCQGEVLPGSGGDFGGMKGLPARHIHPASGNGSCTKWLFLCPKSARWSHLHV